MSMELENVKKNYRILMKQLGGMMAGSIGVPVALGIVSLFTHIFSKPADELSSVVKFSHINGYVMLTVTIYLMLTTVNILSKAEISMYPGTVKTRMTAKLLFDFTQLSGVFLGLVLSNGLMLSVLRAVAGQNKGMVSCVLFDWKTMLIRSAVSLAYCMCIYCIGVLISVMSAKLNDHVFYIVYIVIMVIWLILCATFQVQYIISPVMDFYCADGRGFIAILAKTLATSLVCLVVSYLIAGTIHSWKEHSKTRVGFSGAFLYIVFFGIINSLVFSYNEYEKMKDVAEADGVQASLEKDIAENKVIVKDRVITPGEIDVSKLSSSAVEVPTGLSLLDRGYSVGWCDYDMAKEIGLIPEDYDLEKGSLLVRTVAVNTEYAGKSLWTAYVENACLDILDSEYRLTIPEKHIVYDGMFGLFDNFLKEGERPIEKVEDSLIYDPCYNTCFYIVYHKEDIKEDPENDIYLASYLYCAPEIGSYTGDY
ncbi:MAG: hypothetical protein K2I10_11170 [Lachnospiraceae bacterium]|nr:hypothetical protein [Lachnospiraceae bacterium]